MSEFHVRDGFTYERTNDGEVVIRQYEDDRLEELVGEITATPGEWASVVASVTRSGATAATIERAQALHAA